MKKRFVAILCLVLFVVLVLCTACDMFKPISPAKGNGDDGNESGDQQEADNYVGDKSILSRFSDEETIKNDDFYKKYSEEEKQLYYTLWKDTTTISVKIDIEPSELAKLNEAFVDYRDTGDSTKSDTYRKCNLTINVNGTEYVYQEVGIRMRGNTSRREFCNSEGEIYALVHFRFSLSETFDGDEYAVGSWGEDIAHDWTSDAAGRTERKDRSFATMEKFYYKWNKNFDNTYMREIYANRMFRAYGVLAPHITLAQIQLKQQGNFENLGVCMLYETVDKQFLKRNFSKAERGGDLYKCGWPADLSSDSGYGIETSTQRFTYTLKTNDDTTATTFNNHKYLKALIEAMTSLNKNSSDYRQKLEQYVDMDYFTNFEAVNYLLGNPDCIRNNRNNYYMYFLPSTGKVYFIPYDYDRCLGINKDWNPTDDGMTSAKPFDSNMGASNFEEAVPNPLYTKTILSGGDKYYQQMFQSKLQYVLQGEWFTYAHFKASFDNYKSRYQLLVTPSAYVQGKCGWMWDDASWRLEFSERGTTELSGNFDNVTTEKYMQLKRQMALANLLNFN